MAGNLASSQSEEELTTNTDATGQQTVKRSSTSSPTQVAETSTTSTRTPTGQSVRTVRSAGASPTASREYGQTKTLFHAYQIIWYIFGFIEIVLAFRFILKLLGANPAAGFTKFVYGISSPFAGPFLNIFHASANRGVETTSFFEWSTLVAAVVYVVLTWGIIKIFKLGKPTDPADVERTVSGQ